MHRSFIQKLSIKPFSFRKFSLPYRILLLPLAGSILLLPRLEPLAGNVPGVVHLLGRFHPLVGHSLVVLVLLALLFELVRQFKLFRISAATIGLLLCMLSALEDLFLNATEVSKEVVEALWKNKPDLNFRLEQGKFSK